MGGHVFIIGGGGQVGRAAAAVLPAHGWRVTLASRRGRQVDDPASPGVQYVRMDRGEPDALRRALAAAGGGADALIDTVAYDEGHADQLLEAAHDVGAFVVVSSASVYRNDGGRTLDEARETGFPQFRGAVAESHPTVAPGALTYSTRKAALERRLLERAKCPVCILRPGAIHGTPSLHPREWWFVKRMLDGRRVIPLAFRGRSRFHTAAAANMAALIRVVLGRPATRILNIADPAAPTALEIGARIAKHLGYGGMILPVDAEAGKNAGGVGMSPWSIPGDFVLDTSAAAALGYVPATTYEDSVPEICDWLAARGAGDWKAKFPVLAGYPWELFDYAAEDRFLENLRTDGRRGAG